MTYFGENHVPPKQIIEDWRDIWVVKCAASLRRERSVFAENGHLTTPRSQKQLRQRLGDQNGHQSASKFSRVMAARLRRCLLITCRLKIMRILDPTSRIRMSDNLNVDGKADSRQSTNSHIWCSWCNVFSLFCFLLEYKNHR